MQTGLTYKIEGMLIAHIGLSWWQDEANSCSDDKRQMQGCCLCVTAGVLQLRLGAGDDHERILKVL
jgi:hypothetical protein